MALTTPNEGIDTPETTAKKYSQNDFVSQVNTYMDAQLSGNPNFFLDNKYVPLQNTAGDSWKTRIEDFFRVRGEKIEFSDPKLLNILAARLRGHILQRENLKTAVAQDFDRQFDRVSKKFTIQGVEISNFLIHKTSDFYDTFTLSDLKKYHLSAAAREKYVLYEAQRAVKTAGITDKNAPNELLSEILNVKSSAKEDEVLASMFLSLSADDVKKLNPEAKDALRKILNCHVVHADDVEEILKLDEKILDNTKKAALLEYFLPEMSYADAIQLGIVTQIDAELNLRTLLGMSPAGVDPDVDTFFAGGNPEIYEHFFVKLESGHMKDLSQTLSDEKKKNYLRKIANEMNACNATLILDDELDTLTISDKDDFLKAITKLHTDGKVGFDVIRACQKIQPGATIVLTHKNIPHYYHVSKSDNSGLELLKIGMGKQVCDVTKGTKDTIVDSYQKLYNAVINIEKNAQTYQKEEEKKVTLEVYDEKEFVQFQQTNNITQAPNILTKNDLIEKLDELDPKGKGIDFEHPRGGGKEEKGNLTFMCKNTDKNGKETFGNKSFSITSVDEQKNEIKLDSDEIFSFQEFISAFQITKCQRVPCKENMEHFFEDAPKEWNLDKNYQYKDGNILSKTKKKVEEGGKVKEFDVPLQHFKNTDGNIISLGECKDGKVSIEVGKIQKGIVYLQKYSEQKIPINYIFTYLTSHGFVPCSFEEQSKETQNLQEEGNRDDSKEKTRKTSLWSAYWGLWSIAEVLAGGKKVIESIEQRLERGNKLKAAKFALALGKFLPKELREDLQSMVEQEESATMEELMKQLTSVDSKVMIPRIEKILLNKNAEQYQVEAALFAMLSKYGVLYNKDLSIYRGSFRWYEALGGKIGDNLFLEIKKECENMKNPDGTSEKDKEVQPFTEEYLIEKLLAAQATGKLTPKRRSKIHKEMGKYMGQGIKEEFEDGEAKTKDIMTFEGRAKYCLDELEAGGYANALGALPMIWKKTDGDLEKDFFVPFVITMSNVSTNFSAPLMEKLLDFWGTPCTTMLLMNRSAKNRHNLQKAISYMVKNRFSDDTKMCEEFATIESKKNITDKIKAAKIFWSHHGGKLVKCINDNDYYLYANKDTPELKDYWEYTQAIEGDKDFVIKDDNIQKFTHDKKSISLSTGRQHFPKYLKGGFPGQLTALGDEAMSDVEHQLLDLRQNTTIDDDAKKRAFKELFLLVHGHFVSQPIGTYNEMLKHPALHSLKKFGMNFSEFNTQHYQALTTSGNNPYEKIEKDTYWQSCADRYAEEFVKNTASSSATEIQHDTQMSLHDIVAPQKNPPKTP